MLLEFTKKTKGFSKNTKKTILSTNYGHLYTDYGHSWLKVCFFGFVWKNPCFLVSSRSIFGIFGFLVILRVFVGLG